MLAVALVVTGVMLHAGEPGQATAPNLQSYLLSDDPWQILDLAASVSLPGYAFAQSVNDALVLTPAGKIADTEGANELLLNGARDIATFVSGGITYAAVASITDDGVQIINMSNPASPTAAGQIADTEGANELLLNGAIRITTFVSGGITYAAVASFNDGGVQIINLSNPASPTAAGQIADTEGANELLLNGARDIAIFVSGGITYAAVASSTDGGVQIINMSNPASPTATGKIADTEDANELLLDGAIGITTFVSGGITYAAVASQTDDGVQIINMSNPASPTAAGQIADTEGANGLLLNGADDIITFVSGGITYAAVASQTDDGVQIINLSNPASPTAAGQIADTEGANELLLNGANDIITFVSGGITYAAVASGADDGVQIINLSNPASPTAAGQIVDTEGANELLLDGASRITTFVSGDTTYAAVASFTDNGVQIIRIDDATSTTDAVQPPEGSFVTTWGTTTAGEIHNHPC